MEKEEEEEEEEEEKKKEEKEEEKKKRRRRRGRRKEKNGIVEAVNSHQFKLRISSLLPDECKEEHLHRIKRNVYFEGGLEQCSDCGLRLEPHSGQSEQKRPTHCTEKTPPVVAHSKIGRCNLNTE